ncbi:MAG: hypothetical protein LBT01_08045 [Spirochaetaceae bacterium]|jgi:predicted RNA-binding Zn-ribbon protein involved in translation (DUF1610 family)|nr:hypothetical protein [Spirochaetaceae bacterium]
MTKKARFICDNCGIEVGASEKRCPKCGRYFSSVRCPKCGFAGEEASFTNGCPSCGYSAAPPRGAAKPPPQKEELPLWVYALVISGMILALVLLLFNN